MEEGDESVFSVKEIVLAVLNEIEKNNNANQTNEMSSRHISALASLCGEKPLMRALKLVDDAGVTLLTAHPSCRTLFQVQGKSSGDLYLCLPLHFCSCHVFFYDVVNRGEVILCKHLLAATIAKALGRCKTRIVSDVELANVLFSY
mmetsp:Transcript_34649/g.48030  ORF Transcript_34649/g.48030 Transcript_34649/m.48030 type:complete len:146 (-) Transcript_34649:72-509(-)